MTDAACNGKELLLILWPNDRSSHGPKERASSYLNTSQLSLQKAPSPLVFTHKPDSIVAPVRGDILFLSETDNDNVICPRPTTAFTRLYELVTYILLFPYNFIVNNLYVI